MSEEKSRIHEKDTKNQELAGLKKNRKSRQCPVPHQKEVRDHGLRSWLRSQWAKTKREILKWQKEKKPNKRRVRRGIKSGRVLEGTGHPRQDIEGGKKRLSPQVGGVPLKASTNVRRFGGETGIKLTLNRGGTGRASGVNNAG